MANGASPPTFGSSLPPAGVRGQLRDRLAPFVGRQRELEVLADTLAEAGQGRLRLIVLRGEAGNGKTYLATRAADLGEQAGFSVVWGRCWPHGGAPPLWPWQPVLTELLGKSGAQLLADDPGDDAVDPERFARFDAVARRLGDVVRKRPALVILDDVHAADSGALLLTRFLTRALDRVPLILVLVRRTEEQTPMTEGARLLDELEADALTVQLGRFDIAEAAALLSAYGTDALRPEELTTLLRVTAGSPLLLTQAIAHGSPAAAASTVGQAIADALAAMPAGVIRVLALAAILGPTATVGEIADLAASSPSEVVELLRHAEQRGLVAVQRDECRFEHDLIRESAVATLAPADRLAAHARACQLLAGDDRGEAVVRRAHHALAASPRSGAHAVVAVEAARAAAGVMRGGFDFDGAAAFLHDAVSLSDRLPPRAEWSTLRVEHAEAVLACGRLAEARKVFARAVAEAEASRDHIVLARAAIGLGGVWLNEQRGEIDHQRTLAIQRRALAALGDDQQVMRVRLAVRLAAEAVYEEQPAGQLHEALAAARLVGDGTVLAEALSLAHHALLAPGNGPELLRMSEELMSVASSAGEGVLTLMGLMWRTVDLYQLADDRAERSLAELRQRTEAVGCRSIAYIVEAIDVMRLIRRGSLVEAEEAAASCYELGLQVGDADAMSYYAAQLLTIRYLQGRDVELVDLIEEAAASPLARSREHGMRASAASVSARAGRVEHARTALEKITVDEIPPSSTSLVALMAIVEAARQLGDADVAQAAHAALSPFAALPITPSLAVSCLGSVERPLGIAAMAFGDVALATAHFERALQANRRIGHRPLVAIGMVDLAEALLAAGPASSDDDRPRRVRELLADAVAQAEQMGLTGRSIEWQQRVEALSDPLATRAAVGVEQVGGHWIVHSGDLRAKVANLVGLGYLKSMVDRPGHDFAATDLCGSRLVDSSRHELIDHAALEQYRRRVHELDAEIDEADSDGDIGRAEQLRVQREALRDELGSALGAFGRARGFVDAAERARTSVHKALKRAIEAVAAVEPELGAILRRTVTTGTTCRYEPDAGMATAGDA